MTLIIQIDRTSFFFDYSSKEAFIKKVREIWEKETNYSSEYLIVTTEEGSSDMCLYLWHILNLETIVLTLEEYVAKNSIKLIL